jgi:hypothetical protein
LLIASHLPAKLFSVDEQSKVGSDVHGRGLSNSFDLKKSLSNGNQAELKENQMEANG